MVRAGAFLLLGKIDVAQFIIQQFPSRQIGNCVYVPKQEIDNLYKSEVE